MQKRKIVWICWKDIRHPEAGGAELVHHEISKRLILDGWEVIHLVPGFEGGQPEEIIDGVRVIRIGHSILSFYRLPFYFARHLRRETSFLMDAFISLGSFACLLMNSSYAAIIIHHVEGIKWFFHDRFSGVPWWLIPFFKIFGFFVERLQLIILALLFRGKIITVSESTAKVLRHLGFRRERIEIVSEAITAVPLKMLAASLPKEQQFTIISIGMRKAKRPQHILRAFELFQGKHPAAHLWLAGWGGMEQKLQTYVAHHQIKHVNFLGRVTEEKRNELLQRAHVLCTAPLREGWGLVVIEANAMGTPVIGYDVPGLCDALAFNNGWLCAPTPRGMVDKLEDVFELWFVNRDEYERLRQQCLESAKNFSFDHTYEQFVTLLPNLNE